jgi:hypothetical protein
LYKEVEVVNGFLIEDGVGDQGLSGGNLTRIVNMAARWGFVVEVPVRGRIFLVAFVIILVYYGTQVVA